MTPETKYSYQKRIKELEETNRQLRIELLPYKDTVREIYDGIISCVDKNSGVSSAFLLSRIKRCLK